MRDSGDEKHGKITVARAFELSSNVGCQKLFLKTIGKNLSDSLMGYADLGIDQPLGIEITGEVAPLVKDPSAKSWSGTTLPWMSIGYEVRMTPLQILAFYNAVANNGTLVRPKFVNGISRHGKLVDSFDTEVIESSICSRSTLRKVKALLEGVVENGTAKTSRTAITALQAKREQLKWHAVLRVMAPKVTMPMMAGCLSSLVCRLFSCRTPSLLVHCGG
jgi:cell division protein FtsI (penicillin-binding protein 3)